MNFDNDENIKDPKSFAIHDNSSQFARFLPEKYIEPLVIISKIKGYNGIDEYILKLIRSRLEMFTDTRDELDEDFQEYMCDIMIGKKKDVENPCTPSSDFVEKKKESKEKEDKRRNLR